MSLLKKIYHKLVDNNPLPERCLIGVFGLPEAGAKTLIKVLYDVYEFEDKRTDDEKKQQRNYIFQLIFENFQHVVARMKPAETDPEGTLGTYADCFNSDWRNDDLYAHRLFEIINAVSTDIFYYDKLREVKLHLDARVETLFRANWNREERQRILSCDYVPTISECAQFIDDDNAVFNFDECRFKRSIEVTHPDDSKSTKEVEFVFINRKDKTTFHDFVYDNSSKRTIKSILIVVPFNQTTTEFQNNSLSQLSGIAKERKDLPIDVILDYGYDYDDSDVAGIVEHLNKYVKPVMRKNHGYEIIMSNDALHEDIDLFVTNMVKKK